MRACSEEGLRSAVSKRSSLRSSEKIYAFAYNQKVTYRHSKELLDELLSARRILVSDHGGLFLDLLDMFILKVKLFGFHFASLDVSARTAGSMKKSGKSFSTKLEKQRKSMGWNAFQALKEEEKIRHLLDLAGQSGLPFAERSVYGRDVQDHPRDRNHSGDEWGIGLSSLCNQPQRRALCTLLKYCAGADVDPARRRCFRWILSAL